MNKILSVNEWKREMKDINDPTLLATSNYLVKNNILENKSATLTEDQIKNIPTLIFDLRKAAECHKIVRRDIQNFIKPGVKLLDICNDFIIDLVTLT